MRKLRTPSAARVSILLVGLLFLHGMTGRAAAQGAGIRGGISIQPDQGYFGGHFETSPLVDRLYFRPNVEVGVGDGSTLVALNMEFVYKFPARHLWRLYLGGGPAVNLATVDGGPNRDNRTSTDGGLNLMVGAEQRKGLFFEVKVGAIDSPDVKFGVGYTFR